MFKKKSTRELVRGGSAEQAPEPSAGEVKKKKERPPGERKILTLLRTRTFYGVAAITLGLLVALLGVPALQNSVTETVEVVCFQENVSAGTLLTRDMLTTVELSLYHLPAGAIQELEAVVGQYLTVDAVANDFVTAQRLSGEYPGADPVLLDLPEGKMAISISLPGLAQSVSGKLRRGDVIQIFAVERNDGETSAAAPAELRYVEVLSATCQDGIDVDAEDAGSGGSSSAGSGNTLATVTLLVSERQAACLAGLEQNATLHTALVIRGNDERKAAALAEQEAFLQGLAEQEAFLQSPEEQEAEHPEDSGGAAETPVAEPEIPIDEEAE